MKLSQPQMLERMADHVLVHGLTLATLRPLARAAGTSDRMLIYHFGTKDGVIAALLDQLAARFTAILDATPLPAQGSVPELVRAILPLMQSPVGAPYGAIFLEVVAGAARGIPVFQDSVARILLHFQGWVAARLPASEVPGRTGELAAFALGTIEGMLVLGAAGAPGRVLVEAALAGLEAAAGGAAAPS